jgi:hypothetical protein
MSQEISWQSLLLYLDMGEEKIELIGHVELEKLKQKV